MESQNLPSAGALAVIKSMFPRGIEFESLPSFMGGDNGDVEIACARMTYKLVDGGDGRHTIAWESARKFSDESARVSFFDQMWAEAAHRSALQLFADVVIANAPLEGKEADVVGKIRAALQPSEAKS